MDRLNTSFYGLMLVVNSSKTNYLELLEKIVLFDIFMILWLLSE